MANKTSSVVQLGDLSLLSSNAELYLANWKNEAVRFVNALQFDANRTLQNSERSDLNPLTKKRLQAISKAQLHNRRVMSEILDPLLKIKNDGKEFGARAPQGHPPIAENFSNLFRDWSWQNNEPQEQISLLKKVLPEGSLGRVLILGAGSARLAYDIAETLECESVTATEINPLLFLCASKILKGETIELYDLPELPKSVDTVANLFQFKAPHASTKVSLLLNDFFDDTLTEGSFDTVITPWFIDVVGNDLAFTLSRINRLLKQDGLWANIGPLMFRTGERAELLTHDEALEISRQCGFRISTSLEHPITQLRNENAAAYRTDQIFAWSGIKKVAFTAKPHPGPPLPKYLIDLNMPVKLMVDAGEAAQHHLLMATILEACEQNKSVMQIAEELAPDFGMPKEAIIPLITGLIHDFLESQQANPYLG